jgi:hypothetical protein
MNGRQLVFIATLLAAAAPAEAQSRRAGSNEFYLGPTFTDGKSYSFDGGSTAKTDTGVGLTLGWARNFTPKVSAGFDIAWSDQDYRATVQPGLGNANAATQIDGHVESRTIRFNGTYHFSDKDFTPLVTGGLGWTWIDTNIPSGLPENVCWYYPWYGSWCSTYVPTETSTKFSYNVGAGLRWDVGRGLFRFLVNSQYVDFGGSYGSSNVVQYRLDFGSKF